MLGGESPVTIRTLGVDGGAAYGDGFAQGETPGDTDFEPQFDAVAEAMIRSGLDYQHLEGKDRELIRALARFARALLADRDDLRRHYDPLVTYADALAADRTKVITHRDSLAADREEILARQANLLAVLELLSQM